MTAPACAASNRAVLDTHGLRWAGAAMLGLALALPALPGHPGIPCPLRSLTGVPCPFCGMTTSVEATVHGHLGAAAAANPAGILAVVVATVLLLRRRLVLGVPPAGVLLGSILALWLFELHRFGFLGGG
ncbi:MAG: DUF2752 domain-containing protein [Acidimicrobiales bacterium]